MDRPSPSNSSTLEFIWGQYRAWTVTAQKLKKEITLWRTGLFVFTILGSLMAILSQNIATAGFAKLSSAIGWISTAAVGIASYAGSKILTNEKEKKWIQARSAAENCKSTSYLYFFQVPPYSTKEDDVTLFNKVEALIKTLYSIPQALLSKEEEIKNIPPPSYSFRDYLEERLRKQAREFYFTKAALYRKYVKRGNNWGIVLGIIGFLLGSIGASGISEYTSVWVAFISTVSASVTSFITANRYQFMAMSYQVTGNQLMILWTKGSRIENDNEAQKDFIKNCEDILSAENEAWITELSKQEDTSDNRTESSGIAP